MPQGMRWWKSSCAYIGLDVKVTLLGMVQEKVVGAPQEQGDPSTCCMVCSKCFANHLGLLEHLATPGHTTTIKTTLLQITGMLRRPPTRCLFWGAFPH